MNWDVGSSPFCHDKLKPGLRFSSTNIPFYKCCNSILHATKPIKSLESKSGNTINDPLVGAELLNDTFSALFTNDNISIIIIIVIIVAVYCALLMVYESTKISEVHYTSSKKKKIKNKIK